MTNQYELTFEVEYKDGLWHGSCKNYPDHAKFDAATPREFFDKAGNELTILIGWHLRVDDGRFIVRFDVKDTPVDFDRTYLFIDQFESADKKREFYYFIEREALYVILADRDSRFDRDELRDILSYQEKYQEN